MMRSLDMKLRTIFLGFATLASLQACTWVKSTNSGDAVHMAYDGNVAGCRDVGQVTVSVADHVAFYHRPSLKVRDELETLARNQAASIPADTIRATSDPVDGAQSFEAYVCGGMRMRQRADRAPPLPPPPANGAQTYAIPEH
jgi:Domain of unknown function (DUF4156)